MFQDLAPAGIFHGKGHVALQCKWNPAGSGTSRLLLLGAHPLLPGPILRQKGSVLKAAALESIAPMLGGKKPWLGKLPRLHICFSLLPLLQIGARSSCGEIADWGYSSKRVGGGGLIPMNGQCIRAGHFFTCPASEVLVPGNGSISAYSIDSIPMFGVGRVRKTPNCRQTLQQNKTLRGRCATCLGRGCTQPFYWGKGSKNNKESYSRRLFVHLLPTNSSSLPNPLLAITQVQRQ